MTTIHLTDAQRDTFAACGLIVIDGEVFVSTAERDMIGPRTPGTYTLVPEGWRILTEPCDTCGGTGRARDLGWVEPQRMDMPCPCTNPDCHRGARVVTLTATCPTCHGERTPGWIERDSSHGGGLFDRCDCESGVVTLGRFTIPALLPVVLHDGSEGDEFPIPVVCIHEGGVFMHLDYDTAIRLDLEPRPGQFIARPERVQ